MFLSKAKFAAIAVLTVGLAGSGMGFLHYQMKAIAAAPAPAKVQQPANQDPAERTPIYWRDRLAHIIDYPGLDDPKATLTDALDHLGKRYSTPFYANDQVFRAIDPKISALRFEIAEMPIPPMKASMKTVLQTILGRLPANLGALYVLRKDHVEITTETAVRAELGIPAHRPLLPLIWETLANTPINVAFRRLADQSGYNIVIDPRIADKVQIAATAELNNVPLDTAVRLLANMAGQSVVRLDNVFYVTTADNSKKLSEEQAKINAGTTAKDAEPPKKAASEKRAK